MDYRRVIFAFLMMLPFMSRGQEYKVVSFEPALKDLTARTSTTARVDDNGRKCAVIKVYVDDNIAAVRGNAIGDVPATGMEKWIYLAHDAKEMEIVFDHHYPLHITFMDYDVPSITGQMTYILKLKEDTAFQMSNQNPNNDASRTPTTSAQKDNIENTPSEIFEKEYAVELKKDYSENVRWYRKAADQGNAPAQYNLGVMYRNGYGVTQDYSEAVKWYMKAGEQGYAYAQYNLGIMYEYGYGVTKNISEARKWYEKAAAQGDKDAKERLKNL